MMMMLMNISSRYLCTIIAASRSPRNNPASTGCTAHTMNSQSRPHDDMDSFLQHSLTNGSAENLLCHQDGVALKAMASNSGGRHTAQGKGCLEYQAMTNGQLRHTSNHSDGPVIFKHDSATQTGSCSDPHLTHTHTSTYIYICSMSKVIVRKRNNGQLICCTTSMFSSILLLLICWRQY